jgi:hypothetical protein
MTASDIRCPVHSNGPLGRRGARCRTIDGWSHSSRCCVNARRWRDGCGETSVNAIEERLRREMNDLLIDDLAVLATSLAERAGQPLGNAIGACLREMTWLPECAPLPDLLKATREAFAELDWPERLAELDRVAATWLTQTRRTVSRAIWLHWLHETVVSTSKLREPLGKHPYARAHLLTYGQAESQEWSHVVACDLSEGEWPPMGSDDGWLGERDIATLNSRLPWLNLLATAQGGQGEGHETLRAGHTWCLTPSDEHAIARRQFANLLENTSAAFTAAASLHSATHPERVAQPGELFNRLHFCARGRAISADTLRALRDETGAMEVRVGAVGKARAGFQRSRGDPACVECAARARHTVWRISVCLARAIAAAAPSFSDRVGSCPAEAGTGLDANVPRR